MQLARPKVGPSRSRGPFSLKSAIEHWPSGTDARQSAENPQHEAEVFRYWPCLRNTMSFIPLRYRKSRGTSNYKTSPPIFLSCPWDIIFLSFGIHFHSSHRGRFSYARTILYWWGPRSLKYVINNGHGYFQSFFCVWGIYFFIWLLCLLTFHLGCFIMCIILPIFFLIMPANHVALLKW